MKKVDVLAIGAHPDDIEMSAGGVLVKLSNEGKRVAIVDCTQGEMGSRGDIQIRKKEADAADRILGVVARYNLLMPDGNIEQSQQNVLSVVKILRELQPKILVMPPAHERHPDHEAVHRLCRTAYFKSGMSKISTQDENGKEQEPFRPQHLFCYMQTYHFEPQFYIDITNEFQQKMESIKAHSSQVWVPGVSSEDGAKTFISSPAFMEMLESRARYFGSLIGVQYAEGFSSVEAIGLPSLSAFL